MNQPTDTPSKFVSALAWILYLPLLPFTLVYGLVIRRRQKREFDLQRRETAVLRGNHGKYLASLPPEQASRERAKLEADMAEVRRKVERELGPRPDGSTKGP